MFKLILFNVLKHKFLFLLIGIVVALFCFYLVLGMNTVFSVSDSLRGAVADNLTGHMIITSNKVKQFDMIAMKGEKQIVPLEQWEELLEFLRDKEYIDNASPRLRWRAEIHSDYNMGYFIMVGVDPESEPDLLPARGLDEGDWLETSQDMLMYYRHMDQLNANQGEELGVMIPTVDGYLNADMLTMKGVLEYDDMSFYMDLCRYAFLPLDHLNELITTKEKTAGEIMIRINDFSKIESMKKDIAEKFGDNYRYIEPQDSSPLINGIYTLSYFIVYFVAFLLLIMVYLCSSFIVSVSLEARRKEIGIYQALGVQKWRIGMLFGGEFLTVMLSFGLIGILVGLYFMMGLSKDGISATIIPLKLIFGRSILYIQNKPETVLVTIGFLLAAFLGNIINAIMKLSKLKPIEIMKDL